MLTSWVLDPYKVSNNSVSEWFMLCLTNTLHKWLIVAALCWCMPLRSLNQCIWKVYYIWLENVERKLLMGFLWPRSILVMFASSLLEHRLKTSASWPWAVDGPQKQAGMRTALYYYSTDVLSAADLASCLMVWHLCVLLFYLSGVG